MVTLNQRLRAQRPNSTQFRSESDQQCVENGVNLCMAGCV
jgi:hypothetical protein